MNNPQQGPMENLLQGLDEQSDLLSYEEVTAELADCGVDVGLLLDRIHALIDAKPPGAAGG